MQKRGGKVLETEWTRAKDTYHFKCGNPKHPVFTTTADALYSGEHWCPYCSGRAGDFQNELAKLCEEKDGKLLSEYKSSGEYVTVRCNKHNYVWDILPNNIKKGRWCPICNMGFNEKVVYDYLINSHCNFEIQYSFDDLMGDNNEKLRFDLQHKDHHFGNSPRQIQRQKAIQRDIQKK